MKFKLLILAGAAVIFSAPANGQDWKRFCVTETGDTLRKGDSIKIVSQSAIKTLEYIQPHEKYTGDVWFTYRNHISFMMGNTYAIHRISRMQVSKKPKSYKPIIIISDKHASGTEDVEYPVMIDRALNDGIVQIANSNNQN